MRGILEVILISQFLRLAKIVVGKFILTQCLPDQATLQLALASLAQQIVYAWYYQIKRNSARKLK